MAEDQDTQEPSELRKAAERGAAAAAENEQLRKEMAFIKAGIDTETKLGQMLFKTYEGELTKSALQEEWSSIAPASQPEAEQVEVPEPPPDPRAVQRQQIQQDLASNAAEDDLTDTGEDAKERAWNAYTDDRRQGTDRRLAMRAYVGELIDAAVKGDQTAIFDEAAWRQRALEEDGLAG